MPATVIYKSENAQNQLTQIKGDFTVEPDGFISINLRYLAGNAGLVAALIPKPRSALGGNLFNIRGLPANRGVFVQSCTAFYESGFHFVDVKASSCTADDRFILKTSYNTLAYTGSFTELVGGGQNPITSVTYPFSFLAKVPTATLQTCYLATEKAPQDVFGVQSGLINPPFVPALRVSVSGISKTFKSTIYQFVGRRGRALSTIRMAPVETLNENSDGNIVRASIVGSLQIVNS